MRQRKATAFGIPVGNPDPRKRYQMQLKEYQQNGRAKKSFADKLYADVGKDLFKMTKESNKDKRERATWIIHKQGWLWNTLHLYPVKVGKEKEVSFEEPILNKFEKIFAPVHSHPHPSDPRPSQYDFIDVVEHQYNKMECVTGTDRKGLVVNCYRLRTENGSLAPAVMRFYRRAKNHDLTETEYERNFYKIWQPIDIRGSHQP
jgi:hypothetical protein